MDKFKTWWTHVRQGFKLENILVATFSVLIVSCLVSVGFAKAYFMDSVDAWVHRLTDIWSFASMIFAAIALFVSALAYKAAVPRPKLALDIEPSGPSGPSIGIHPELQLQVERRKEGKWIVTETMPSPTWRLFILNTGNASARYPVVQIKFCGLFFAEEAFQGWRATHHLHGQGYYGFQWSPGQNLVLHPKFPVELPPIPFRGIGFGCLAQNIEDADTAIEVTVAADGFYEGPTKTSIQMVEVGRDVSQ